MNKRWRYAISAILSAFGFYLYLWLPVESRYYGLALQLALLVFCFWFGLGVLLEGNIDTKIMVVLLPGLMTLGYGLFTALLPSTVGYMLVSCVIYGTIIYLMFLVENVFMVAIGYKTVPLYRAAYTVNLILVLLSAFFLFDSLLSFKLAFWANIVVVGVLAMILFGYQFWAIAIELPDDGAGKGKWTYIGVASGLLAQLALVFSFWPVGIFRGSVYLVAAIYLISGLFQADIRERLFRGVMGRYALAGAAISLAIVLTNNWK